MKHTLITMLLALSFTASASAAGYAAIEIANVDNLATKQSSTEHVFRAGTQARGLDFELAARTAVQRQGGMQTSLEGTVGKSFGPLTVFTGVGHDSGYNGGKGSGYQYGLVGVGASKKFGAVDVALSAKTRVNWQSVAPDQTTVMAEARIPLNKQLSLSAHVSRSYHDVQEKSAGVGLRFAF